MIGVTIACTTTVLATSTGVAQAQRPSDRPGTVVRVDTGWVRGATVATEDLGQVRVFRGVPYAAAPVGELRWRAPQPAMRWTGVRDATQPAPACPQETFPPRPTSEDCLTLDVWSPAGVRQPTPVVVWIHGGGFVTGSANEYDASRMAALGNVTVVAINYRLGPLGFLDLPEFDNTDDPAAAGLFGLADQQAALRWVQRNIRAFGGNPNNVTVMGESAGGSSVCALMAARNAPPAFQRAISQSGCGLSLPTTQVSRQLSEAVTTQAGCADTDDRLACLRSRTPDAIIAADTSPAPLWGPTIGGPTLPVPIETAFANGQVADVPFLQGTTADEGTFFAALGVLSTGQPPTAATYLDNLFVLYGPAAPAVAAEYPLSSYPSAALALAASFTDARFACPGLRITQLAAHSRPAFLYEFADRAAPPSVPFPTDIPLGAAHASELPYLFTTATTAALTGTQRSLGDEMIRYWTRFAATGRPGAPHDQPRWTRLDRTGTLAVFDQPGTRLDHIDAFTERHRCTFWNDVTDN